MFSKQEAQELKKEFWIAFGKSFPRKWLLYDTKIKDFSFKFFTTINMSLPLPELLLGLSGNALGNKYPCLNNPLISMLAIP